MIIISTLNLITTERFGEINCDFYRNMNDEILLTRTQIGTALEYTYPDDALSKIHKRHNNRLDPLSVVANLASTDGKMYDTTLYSQRGVMEICRWSNKPKANLFMDWCWDIIEKYRNGTLGNINLQPIINMMTKLIETNAETNTRLSKLEEQQNKLLLPKKTYSRWTSKMFPKYQLLMDYFNISRSELYHNLYIELENQNPEIDLKQLQEDYCYEHGINNCFTLDAIEHNKTIRTSFEFMVDNLLDDYNLIDSSLNNTPDIRPTIFNL